QDHNYFFAQFAIDVPTFLSVYDEFVVPPEEWEAFRKDRQGAVVGQVTADRFGWKVGDRIPLKGGGFPGDWEFNLRAIYTGRKPNDDLTQFWFHWDYLREKAPSEDRDYIGWYVLRVEKGASPAGVSRAI